MASDVQKGTVQHAVIGGAAAGCVGFALLLAYILAAGQTFGQRCDREAGPGETHAECVRRLAR